MSPELQEDIDEIWDIEQNETSLIWNQATAAALSPPGSITTVGEPQNLQRVAVAHVKVISDKSARVIHAIETQVTAHGAKMTDADRSVLEQRFQKMLQDDMNYSKSLINGIPRYGPAAAAAACQRLDQAGLHAVRRAQHVLKTKLVAMKNQQPEKPSVSIQGSNNIVGDQNTSSGNRAGSADSASTSNTSNEPGILNKILVGVAIALIAGFLIWKFGWNK